TAAQGGDLMLLLRAGLYVAALVALWVTWASAGAGYAIEVAMLRGLLAFMAVIFVAYLAELVVITAPPAPRETEDLDDLEGGDAFDDPDGDGVADADGPTTLPALRAERDAGDAR